MSMQFDWSGTGWELIPGCAVTHLVIDDCYQFDDGKLIYGTITIVDQFRGVEIMSKELWQAKEILTLEGMMAGWKVVRDERDGMAAFHDPETGEACLSVNGYINLEMKNFIIQMIMLFLQGYGTTIDLVRYSGAMKAYTGPCVCDLLDQSDADQPFPWKKLTLGQYPQRCFQCSCKTRWWCADEELQEWWPVDDPAAWKMLLEFNGVPVEPVGIYEGKIYLFDTLNDVGLVPIWISDEHELWREG